MAAPRSVSVSVTMTCQEADFWCWAAVAQTVEQHFGTTTSQADIATDHVARHRPGTTCAATDPPGGPGCGGTTCNGTCNSPHGLGMVLSERRLLTVKHKRGPSFSELTALIDASKPVPVRIAWNAGGGHFVCVVGYAVDGQGGQSVEVLDPLQPGQGLGAAVSRQMPFADFSGAYYLSGDTGKPSHFYGV